MLALVPATVVARPRDMSPVEVSRLERGRIVRRPLMNNSRGLIGGTSWIVIDAPLDTVWRTMGSLPAYRLMFPSGGRIQVLEEEGSRRLVRIDQEETVGTFTWVIGMVFDARRHEVRFRLDRNHRHVVDDGWGYVSLAAHGPAGDRTLVTFGAIVDPGDDALVRDLLDIPAQRRLLGMPRRLKAHIEALPSRRAAIAGVRRTP